MRAAYHVGRQFLPAYSSRFSRKDFTLPQLFACLVVKEHQRKSYRGAEELLRDSDPWLRDVGMAKAPDHNTLQRAAAFLLRKPRVDRALDVVARWAAVAHLLTLTGGRRKGRPGRTHRTGRPGHGPVPVVAIDSTHYESWHVSRHYEHRRKQTGRRGGRAGRRDRTRRNTPAAGKKKAAGKKPAGTGRRPGRSGRSGTVRRLPKLAVGVFTRSHLILSVWTGTGGGSDHPHFEPVLFDAWRRVPARAFPAALDAGYDSEPNHVLARRDLGVRTLIPATAGRPRTDGRPPAGRWRRHMAKLLGTKAGRKRTGYTQRWQSETVHSMMKRNLGSALAGKTARSRKRDMHLKALTHDLMVLDQRVETEQYPPR